ncbi:MAG: hypothetical protein HYV39_00845 [Candidatus Levybacteria bacterium]|nr:hypothetical protein [Candidatus Levybacteria bacterium]
MLTKNDLEQIRTIVKEETHFEIKISEGKILEAVDEKIRASEKRIISEVGNFIDQAILPQLDDKADKKDVQRLEQKLDSLLHAN